MFFADRNFDGFMGGCMRAKRKQKAVPAKIVFEWLDPWTGEFCAGAELRYTRDRAANGHYSKSIRRFKEAAKQFTGIRTPVLKLRFIIESGIKSPLPPAK
jgi:hypothetical protein